jgi:hypothetical protein
MLAGGGVGRSTDSFLLSRCRCLEGARIWRGEIWGKRGGEKRNRPGRFLDRGGVWRSDQFRDLANSSLFMALKIFHSSL